MSDLRRIDLNLLLTLDALLTEVHVTRAAVRLHKSQPAISHALSQLRDIFQDPLLIRQGGRMVLTNKAKELSQPLREALHQLESIIKSPMFLPSETARRFRISLSDYTAQILLPKLVRNLRVRAPNIDLAISQSSRETMLAQLMDGEVDLALGVFPNSPPGIKVSTLFEEYFISVADKAILKNREHLSLEEWLYHPHVLVAVRPDAENEIDIALAKQGYKRHVAVILPHWGVATKILRGTDLILTVAHRALVNTPSTEGLVVFPPPLDLPHFTFQQAWHERRSSDPAHIWLREAVVEIMNAHC